MGITHYHLSFFEISTFPCVSFSWISKYIPNIIWVHWLLFFVHGLLSYLLIRIIHCILEWEWIVIICVNYHNICFTILFVWASVLIILSLCLGFKTSKLEDLISSFCSSTSVCYWMVRSLSKSANATLLWGSKFFI